MKCHQTKFAIFLPPEGNSVLSLGCEHKLWKSMAGCGNQSPRCLVRMKKESPGELGHTGQIGEREEEEIEYVTP